MKKIEDELTYDFQLKNIMDERLAYLDYDEKYALCDRPTGD